ncbi:PREDICTED: cellulose synthase-like protein E6 [Nelumbo nucifera]|uniref:Cellulose synthase-like protein E6 n=1 Tax=Nelumbo nucifera TaxID=4432 RepID=A0A1U8Q238_NELNU|nr:PREDICTED: cellulose synthase-like protein E6 [Nelumbo nucifera]
MGVEGYLPLFETEELKGRIAYRLYALSVLVCISLFLAYRVTHFPGKEEDGRWAWIGMFGAELWFSLYWMINQSARWKPVIRRTFKDRLSQKYENELPGVDIFVCTADPKIEPPAMVINTVLSVMAYDYPPEKLSVYLSDDGGSDLTFYALDLKIQGVFENPHHIGVHLKLYKDMENRVEIVTTQGEITEEMRKAHKGFLEWVLDSNPRDHQTILQILIDGRDHNFVDMEGKQLPTLVYMAREKRPNYHHNFKAGAMNALIRVSSQISNGEIILNVDCDMYSNNSESIRDALCFFMDEEKGNEIAFVQYPQVFNNNTKNDIYGSLIRIGIELELHGLDGYGGPLYVGTGCFHRREALCGRKYNKEYKRDWKRENTKKVKFNVKELEEKLKGLSSCTYEVKTGWGKEMGLVYGCPVEDVVTGLTIKCRGWRAIYFNPARRSFLGLAPTTLAQALLQHKRWCEGHFKIVFSKHYSLWQGHGRIKAGLQIGYCIYNMWGFNCIPTLCYIIIPSLCLLQGIVLFPSISSPWFIPLAYLVIAKYTYSLGEFLFCGGTLQGWWNDQRMWMFRRTSSYLFALIDLILQALGFSKSAFLITAKVTDTDVSQRYEKEIMEFGIPSPLFLILATLALLNLFSLVMMSFKSVVMNMKAGDLEALSMQMLLCGTVVALNLPVYQALFRRKDKGRIPSSITFKSVVLALSACIMSSY